MSTNARKISRPKLLTAVKAAAIGVKAGTVPAARFTAEVLAILNTANSLLEVENAIVSAANRQNIPEDERNVFRSAAKAPMQARVSSTGGARGPKKVVCDSAEVAEASAVLSGLFD